YDKSTSIRCAHSSFLYLVRSFPICTSLSVRFSFSSCLASAPCDKWASFPVTSISQAQKKFTFGFPLSCTGQSTPYVAEQALQLFFLSSFCAQRLSNFNLLPTISQHHQFAALTQVSFISSEAFQFVRR